MSKSSKRQSIPRTFWERYGPTKVEFYKAQNGLCSLCGKHLGNLDQCNYDHVQTFLDGGNVFGNVLLTHVDCNSRRPGTLKPCESHLQILNIVNERLGWDGFSYTKTLGYYKKKYEKAVLDMHWDYGIKIIRYNMSFKLIDSKAEHLEAIVDHFQKIFNVVSVKPSINELGQVSFIFRHKGLK